MLYKVYIVAPFGDLCHFQAEIWHLPYLICAQPVSFCVWVVGGVCPNFYKILLRQQNTTKEFQHLIKFLLHIHLNVMTAFCENGTCYKNCAKCAVKCRDKMQFSLAVSNDDV